MLSILTYTVMLIMTIYASRDARSTYINKRSIAAKTMFFVLITYQLFSYTRFTTGEVEIFSSPSMIALYIVLEVYFFYSTDFHQKSYLYDWRTWVFLNHIPFFAVIMYFYVHFFMGYDDHFYSMADIEKAIDAHYFCIFTRSTLMLSLLIYEVIMASTICYSYYSRNRELKEEPLYDSHPTWISRELTLWCIAIITMFLGIAINSPLYHTCSKLILLAAAIWSFIGFWRLNAMERSKGSLIGGGMKGLHKRMEQWLQLDPFPLRSTNITMDDVADALQEDRERLSDYIYNVMGLPFTAWLSDRKLEYCCRLLHDPDKNITDIALEAGYADMSSMSKAFKRKYGIPPTAYRRKLLKK